MPSVLRLLLCILLGAVPLLASADKLPRLVLAGPFANVSNPLIRMVDSGALDDWAEQVEFVSWRTPDQLRALAIRGDAEVVAMPVNVAANLYNRGVELQMLNVSTWGVLWMVSRDPQLQTLADFRDREVLVPFRGDMPDILFRLLASQQGIDPQRDMRLRYVASPLDAMQLLITRRADHALLAEPAISMALRRTRSFPVSVIAPELHRSVDLQVEWGRLFQREARIPQAGLALMGAALQPTLAAAIQTAYAEALAWCAAEPDVCGELVAAQIDMLTPEAVADSIRVSPMQAVPAAAARDELEFLFTHLLEQAPGLVGGKLPDDGFYHMQP
ncbi:ABC transporter substrate-binding protein [Halopseudomonas yangmingensis]|uniref:NitT/TauT family transport system substrate-binding protein n=1 Tax=Halopseudomonas yangmingensis TaxID=1720063 RepID=A0A1I4SH47_9GAMM|nr:ABC transporter substrate-binding protein [Halopseudomonas yangmingensis]SFM63734.1 NitT/TauT family transport system substrate-binding protein [Halopseudomonas yangmingensis]